MPFKTQFTDAHLGSPVVVPLVAGVADLVEAVHGGDVLGPGGGRGGHLATQPGEVLLVILKVNWDNKNVLTLKV